MIMNKKVILVFTLTLAAFLMVAAVSAEGIFDMFNGDNQSYPADDNFTFVVGYSEFPPFGYKDGNGDLTGSCKKKQLDIQGSADN